jgi:broad specificity phosphatase PhoE
MACVVAGQVHLVRHGEVFNPDGVLYGRLPGYRLSTLGRDMARAASDALVASGRPVGALISSPLERTRESAEPIGTAFALTLDLDERLIEPHNHFEGTVMKHQMRNPLNWPYVINPWRPSWGEPYARILSRMRDAVDAAFDRVDHGDAVLVSHQLPIWTLHLGVAGERLSHDPRKRRCALSSITSFERRGHALVEVGYREPADGLLTAATDVGAV